MSNPLVDNDRMKQEQRNQGVTPLLAGGKRAALWSPSLQMVREPGRKAPR